MIKTMDDSSLCFDLILYKLICYFDEYLHCLKYSLLSLNLT